MRFFQFFSPDDTGGSGTLGGTAAPGATQAGQGGTPDADFDEKELSDDPLVLKAIIKRQRDAIRKDGNRRQADGSKIQTLESTVRELSVQVQTMPEPQTTSPGATTSAPAAAAPVVGAPAAGASAAGASAPTASALTPEQAAELLQLREFKVTKDAEDAARREALKAQIGAEQWDSLGLDAVPTLNAEKIVLALKGSAASATPSIGQEQVLGKNVEHAEGNLSFRDAARKKLMGQ